MAKKVVETSVVSSALGDLRKTISALDRSKKGLRSKINELNSADESYKVKKDKLREQIKEIIKKESWLGLRGINCVLRVIRLLKR